jgi:glutamate dehydrogenase (NAD(P)+)
MADKLNKLGQNLRKGLVNAELKKWRWRKKADEPILVKEVDLNGKRRGWLVVDSLGDGQAVGGVRMGEAVTLDEVQKLAAEMTLKFSFLNLPVGGAKAGIYNPSSLSIREREDLFLRFGKGLGPLLRERIYLPGTDMGTYPRDIDQLLRGAGIVERRQTESLDSGFYTAVSVFSALEATASVLGIPLAGARIGIQGLGKVGLRMVQLALKHSLKIVAVSTKLGMICSSDGLNGEQIVDLAKQNGDNLILHYKGVNPMPPEELFEQDVEILCPCAGLYPIHLRNVEKIKAKMVVSGCNVTAAPEVEARLFDRGITYLPGFACNSGGVLCYLLSSYGFRGEEISEFLNQGIHYKVASMLIRARESGESPCAMAHWIVKQNQERFAGESEAMLQGKLRMAASRFKNSGTREMVRTAMWPFVRSALSGPPSLRRGLAKGILFKRLFN